MSFLVVLSLSMLTLSSCSASHPAAAQQQPTPLLTVADIAVGMNVRRFTSIFPAATIPDNGQWARPAVVHGLRGEWTYSFNAKRLSWFVFNSFESNVTKNTFKQYLDSTRSTIAGYTKEYGAPGQILRGILEFKDPRQGYPGYPVLKASWKTGKEQIQVHYSVLGSAQAKAQLLFTVDVRR